MLRRKEILKFCKIIFQDLDLEKKCCKDWKKKSLEEKINSNYDRNYLKRGLCFEGLFAKILTLKLRTKIAKKHKLIVKTITI